MLYNLLIHLLGGPALTLHQSVVEENGLEAWRLLRKRYDPKNNVEEPPALVKDHKSWKGEDVTRLPRPGQLLGLLGEHFETRSPAGCRGNGPCRLLIMMAPDELRGTILEHADRLQNHA